MSLNTNFFPQAPLPTYAQNWLDQKLANLNKQNLNNLNVEELNQLKAEAEKDANNERIKGASISLISLIVGIVALPIIAFFSLGALIYTAFSLPDAVAIVGLIGSAILAGLGIYKGRHLFKDAMKFFIEPWNKANDLNQLVQRINLIQTSPTE